MKKLVLLIVILAVTCVGITAYAAEADTDVTTIATITEEVTDALISSETISTTEGDISTTDGVLSTTESAISTTESAIATTEGDISTTEETPVNTDQALISTEVTTLPNEPSEDPPTDVGGSGENQPFGKWLWDTITKNILAIFAALSVAVSSILLYLNKRSLFPFVQQVLKKVLGALGTSEKNVKDWKETAEKEISEYRKAVEEQLKAQNEELNTYKAKVDEALDYVAKLAKTVENEGQLIIQCLSDQEDTLNTIVQSSTLAQWKKDEAGAKHAAHVAAISDFQKPKVQKPTEEGGEDA